MIYQRAHAVLTASIATLDASTGGGATEPTPAEIDMHAVRVAACLRSGSTRIKPAIATRAKDSLATAVALLSLEPHEVAWVDDITAGAHMLLDAATVNPV